MEHRIMSLKRIALLAFTCLFGAFHALGWGRVGHDAVSYIAECHLTPTAKVNIEKYLDGESIVYDSSWLDLIRDTPEYKHTGKCHMYNIGADGKYQPRPQGDAVSLLNQQIELLRDYKNLPDSTVNVGIKIIVHVMGDLHCPSHPDFEGVNQWFDFDLNGKSMGFHRFWDYHALETCHKWFYHEYQHQLDRLSPGQIAEICEGTVEDWANETARDVAVTYQWITPETKLDKQEANLLLLKSARLADRQIVKAAYRLSHVLNSIFDSEQNQSL